MSKKNNRIGEVTINKQGLEMKIIEYYNCKNITVQFEDGYIVYKKRYVHFQEGNIGHPNYNKANFKNRVGMKKINNKGEKMTIIEYRGVYDIDVQFEDGYIVKHRKFGDFEKGTILHPTKCYDSVSIPEKFMMNILKQLNVEYITQLSKSQCKWCESYRYDFFIYDLNMIIETHGLQHYKENNRGKFLEKEQNNDKIKKELALKNGVNNYIVVDCRYSKFDWLKENVIKELNEYFDLSNINWELAWENSLKNLIWEVKRMYELNYLDTEIAKEIGVCVTTIINYKRQLGIKTINEIKQENLLKTKELLEQGKTNKEIAEILNVNRKVIEDYKRQLGIKTINEIKQENLLKTKELLEQGKTNKEIAEILNVHKSTIGKYIKELAK